MRNTRFRGWRLHCARHTILDMATPIWKAATAPQGDQPEAWIATLPPEATSLNLAENSESPQQQEVLDALPVLVFLEREGKLVFANAEARHSLGLAEEEWTARPVEAFSGDCFPARLSRRRTWCAREAAALSMPPCRRVTASLSRLKARIAF